MLPFEAYEMFLALRNHFNTKSYDYIKYGGKLNMKEHQFLQRNDRMFYYKLSRHADTKGFIIANLLVDNSIWIGDLMKTKAEKNYVDWKARNQSLTYTFKNDIKYILSKGKSLRDTLVVTGGQYPPLLQYHMESKISPETLLIINDLTGAFSRWDKKIGDAVLWPDIYLKLRKYKSFFDPEKSSKEFGGIIIDILGKE
jgi:hypothetical protein